MDNEDLYAALKPDGTPQQHQTRAERIILNELRKEGEPNPWRCNLICYLAQLALIKAVDRMEKREIEGKQRKKRGPHPLKHRIKTAATLRLKKNKPSTLPADVFTKLRNLDVPEPPPPEELADLENKKGLENFLMALKAKKDEPEKPS